MDCSSTTSGVTISWGRVDGSPLSNNAFAYANGTLIIRSAEDADAGRYVCTVSNNAANITAFGSLFIICMFRKNINVEITYR